VPLPLVNQLACCLFAAGYTNAAHIAKDTDLDALRDREDFKKLVAELEAGEVEKASKK